MSKCTRCKKETGKERHYSKHEMLLQIREWKAQGMSGKEVNRKREKEKESWRCEECQTALFEEQRRKRWIKKQKHAEKKEAERLLNLRLSNVEDDAHYAINEIEKVKNDVEELPKAVIRKEKFMEVIKIMQKRRERIIAETKQREYEATVRGKMSKFYGNHGWKIWGGGVILLILVVIDIKWIKKFLGWWVWKKWLVWFHKSPDEEN